MENLVKIQSELKVPKGNFNSFGKYKYRSAEDILEAIKPLLNKYNCTLVLTDNIEVVGNKLFLVATAKFIEASSTIEVKGWAEMSEHKGMSSEQCTGTASSYARKYALNGLFLIDETESDTDNNKTVAPQQTVTTQQIKKEFGLQEIEDCKTKIQNCKTKTELTNLWNKMSKQEKDTFKELVTQKGNALP